MPNRIIRDGIRRSLFQQPCRICGRPDDIEIDHIVPMARGGSNDVDNLQPLCRVCNAIKGARRANQDVLEWISKHKKLFELKQAARTSRLQAILQGGYF
jgi:5-methylcytosine-specific restriction endonuclease McrA